MKKIIITSGKFSEQNPQLSDVPIKEFSFNKKTFVITKQQQQRHSAPSLADIVEKQSQNTFRCRKKGTDIAGRVDIVRTATASNHKTSRGSTVSSGLSSEEGSSRKLTILEAHGYELLETLGHGAYATVKLAHSTRHKGQVAVKIVSKRRAPPEYITKFLPREIDVIKILKHPNLVCFLQSIETTNRVYLIMELAENGDLLEIIRKEGFCTEPKAGRWYHQLVDGVEYCHSKGVVHRDLKCENLLLDKRNNIKITDFGFAKANVQTGRNSGQLSETYCGSYAYACPEILHGIPYDPQQADVWSTGVILYVMVFGRLPFDDSNLKMLLQQIQQPPFLPEYPVVSPECKTLIAKILTQASTRIYLPDIRNEFWFLNIYAVTRTSKDNNNKNNNNNKSDKGSTSSQQATPARL